jgi:glycerol-3-phosphate dehydrogenase
MKIAIIGGGINGVMAAWELCKKNHQVTMFEKTTVMSQTSSASTKLLHGGLRYLENFEFSLVKEALGERQWWIKKAPKIAKPIKIFIPVYKKSRRPAWVYKMGLTLYDLFAGKENIGKHLTHEIIEMEQLCPDLIIKDLVKGFSYFDGQMDDYKLGIWAFNQVKKYKNFTIREKTIVNKVNNDGVVCLKEKKEYFDKVINIAGPWAKKLLKDSKISSKYDLDLVRGSHIVVNRKFKQGYLLEVPNERRIFFVLPYKGQALIGTTEVRQKISNKVKPSQIEINYLINSYNYYFLNKISKNEIVNSFAGLRPLVKSSENPNKAKREYAVESNKNLISIFGGKWTSARALGKKISEVIK